MKEIFKMAMTATFLNRSEVCYVAKPRVCIVGKQENNFVGYPVPRKTVRGIVYSRWCMPRCNRVLVIVRQQHTTEQFKIMA